MYIAFPQDVHKTGSERVKGHEEGVRKMRLTFFWSNNALRRISVRCRNACTSSRLQRLSGDSQEDVDLTNRLVPM